MDGVRPSHSPPLGVVAPFFVAAPLGAALAGYLLTTTHSDALLAVNTPELVAATHAAVLGWITVGMMGAIYQLGSAVFGGRLLSTRLARLHFVLHVGAVAWFALATRDWDTSRMVFGAAALSVSFGCFFVNALTAARWPSFRTIPQAYTTVALVFLAGTGAVGVVYALGLDGSWFPVTQGRLGGHAHLGLLGWLALTLMGFSYQLVPMFEVVRRGTERLAWPALAITAAATAVGAPLLMTDPDPTVRFTIAVAFAAGPLLWLIDTARLLHARARRTLDIHSRATFVSLGFLLAAIVVGIGVAIGESAAPAGEVARLQLAYGVLAIGGWGGATFIANSFKIVPFLVWNARYLPLAGHVRVPLLADLTDARLSHAVLVLHAVAIALVAGGALVGSLNAVHAGGWLLAVTGVTHFAALASVLTRHPSREAVSAAARPGTVLP